MPSARYVPICVPKHPPPERWRDLAKQAQAIRPDNVPEGLDIDAPEAFDASSGRLTLDLRLRWPKTGVSLTVGFLDDPEAELRRKILDRMNAWSKTANVAFTETTADVDHADVRIARKLNDGHWSWLGIDIRNHPGEPTMNLDGFTLETPDAELDRVVCHETGHTLGFPHEHLRQELIDLLDRDRTIAYYMRTQRWTRQDVVLQLFSPLEEGSILSTERPDPRSIMCYEIPGECTKSGEPILGGSVIDEADFEMVSRIYPKTDLADR
ncbi:Hypothetical protein A7982_10826 [Minicystis rosea]|nr:Hypothetical protein A7982_10826 [Minicystis rosea]